MFRELDDLLRATLDASAAPPLLRDADVTFRTPDRTFRVDRPTVDLFLYDVRENRQLRDPVPVYQRIGSTYVRRRPPIRVDCTYLVTAWSNQANAAGIAEEHRLLAFALAWFSRTAYLVQPADRPPFGIPLAVAQADDDRRYGEFWSALGISPRAAFGLTATLAIELDWSIPDGPPVITKHLELRRLLGEGEPEPAPLLDEVFQIAGRVRRAETGDPIPDAEVSIAELGQRTRTDRLGRFTLGGLTPGTYTLRASATGLADLEQVVVVPGPSATAYDLRLSA
jgi:hypothetical protein